MANSTFFFYFSPTWDWPPEGPIKLGNVLTTIKRPERPLYTAPPPTPSEVFSSEKTNVEYSKEKLRGGGFSIFTTFLSILGFGVDVNADWTKSEGELYSFKRIETTQFVPTEDYIQKCIEAEAVRRYLEIFRYRKPVYVITGLKVVYGASAKSFTSQAHSGGAAVAVDDTIWSGGAVPVSVKPGIERRLETSKSTAWEGSSDFIFAFRVRKVHVSKKTGMVDHNNDYSKGAMLGNKSEDSGEVIPDLFISSQENPIAGDEGYDEEILREGETVVSCAIPRVDGSKDDTAIR